MVLEIRYEQGFLRRDRFCLVDLRNFRDSIVVNVERIFCECVGNFRFRMATIISFVDLNQVFFFRKY